MADHTRLFPLLRRELCAVALLVVVAGIALERVQAWAGHEAVQLAAARAGLSAAEQRRAAVERDLSLLTTHAAAYSAAVAAGHIGEEDRLSWLETLHEARETLGLPVLRYALRPRTPLTGTSEVAQGVDFAQYRSELELDLGLLHEADLGRLLRFIEREAPGFFLPEHCDLQATDASQDAPLSEPRIRAHCLLSWFTLSLPASRGDPQ